MSDGNEQPDGAWASACTTAELTRAAESSIGAAAGVGADDVVTYWRRGQQYLPLEREHAAPAVTIDASGTLARWLRVNGRVLVFAARPDVWEDLDPDDQRALSALEATAAAPALFADDLAGIVLVVRQRPQITVDAAATMLGIAAGAAARYRELRRASEHEAHQRRAYRSQQLSTAGQMAASVAHEVRNPLAAIRSIAQLVRDVELPPDRRHQLLTDVVGEVDRLDDSVSGLLTLTRPRESVRELVDVSAVAAQSASLLAALARRRGLMLDTDTPASAWMLGDQRELKQALLNVLLNALEACGPGAAIRLRVRQPSAEPSRLTIDVTDTGCGMAPEHAARAFEPFFTTKGAGTGLGLAVTREIVERMGGAVTLTSTPGSGTVVTLSFAQVHGQHPDR